MKPPSETSDHVSAMYGKSTRLRSYSTLADAADTGPCESRTSDGTGRRAGGSSAFRKQNLVCLLILYRDKRSEKSGAREIELEGRLLGSLD